ncbi:acyl-CoA carboxylase subunit beta [Spongisporangium articulatum]|uniref:Acyl-CoA carboxylase subunit beta n=1 Tax=Spongisporangium articulatum TaxID=3362603 RepID=A0ABW8ARR5_9ACTN
MVTSDTADSSRLDAGRTVDPRDPAGRLERFFDDGPRLTIRSDLDTQPAGLNARLSPDRPRPVVAEIGTVDGRQVVAFACDPRIGGGAMSEESCAGIVAAYDEALARQLPIVGIWHSGGARLDEGVRSLHGVGRVFAAMTRASGRIPQISVVIGPAAGGAAYGPALTDVVVQAPTGKIFVTGPDVVRWATGEDVTADDLGGVDAHGSRSGVSHVIAVDEDEAMAYGRHLCALLTPDPAPVDAEQVADRDLAALLPRRPGVVYDVRGLVDGVLDEPGLELQAGYARNVVTTLGRFGGRPVGIVANNPTHLVGCLDSAGAEKAARFVRLCDGFGLPIIVLVDVPGYLPGSAEELGGIVRRGAKLLHAFAETVVPTATVVTRKAYGGAYIAMNSRSLGADACFAWPGAEIAVMSPISSVRVLHRRALAGVAGDRQRAVLEQILADEHAAQVDGVAAAVELGILDAEVRPDRTRSALAEALARAAEKAGEVRGGHGNIPL